MTEAGFARALPIILAYEGGKVDNAHDPGGRTNQGVIQRVYDAYRARKHLPAKDVYAMLDTERDEIYRDQYWSAVQGDKLPAGVDLVVFDGAVNSGPKQSIKWLQRALNINADGVIGQMTLAAVAADLDNDALIGRIIDRREAFLRSLTTFATFGNGWLSRTSKLKVTAQAWASGRSAPPVAPKAVVAQPKAVIEDAKTAPPKGLADAATGGGVTSGGLAVTLNGLKDQLSPYSTMFDWAGKIVVALLIISAVLTIGGLAYRFWATRKKAKLANALNTTAGAQP